MPAEKIPAAVFIRVESLVCFFIGKPHNLNAVLVVAQDVLSQERGHRLYRVCQTVINRFDSIKLIGRHLAHVLNQKIGNDNAGA